MAPMLASPSYGYPPPPHLVPLGSAGKKELKKLDQSGILGLNKNQSYQQQFNPLFSQGPQGNNSLNHNKSYVERRLSNKFLDNSDEEDNPEVKNDKGQRQQLGYNGQQILMFNDEEIPSESRR